MDSTPSVEDSRRLHSQMLLSPSSTLFTSSELLVLLKLEPSENEKLMGLVQSLINQNLVKLVKQGSELKFQAIDVSEAVKRSNMTQDEAILYSYIEASGREGIWTKTLKAKTNLHQSIVLRSLKSLESQRFIKVVKSVKFPTRKIYMLYHLMPSIEVTGGPWFTDGELDSEFVESLLTIVWRFVASKTFPQVFSNAFDLRNNKLYTANYKNYCTLEEILDFIINSQVTSEELIENDIRSLAQVLVYDDKLEKINVDCYRATMQSVVDLKEERLTEDFCLFDYLGNANAAGGNELDDIVYFDERVL
ncbi:hypothetical protein WICPIJ_001258 [Wickerhamomyces pijperi]|uniref:DNA-directed RNA polymerase III subunit RPC6 n=1 Tax=Wickerhamomyces pijperi TaxID=599730 RepID=A0A9P8QC36_WICPI|nr:hypothetical protein WICPIJ_001258 [Wickerhamomyces pijperi]